MADPFADLGLAGSYEAWYETEGRASDRRERELLGWLLSGFPGGQTALEIGTGTGHFLRWLRTIGWRAVGLDRSAGMLGEAARRNRVGLVHGDAGALPFGAGSFDVALMITTLEFLPDPVRALQEAARVAQSGLVLGVLNRMHPLARQRRQSGAPLWQAAHFYTPRELQDEVRAALGGQAFEMTWRTTLVPRAWPVHHSRLPIGAFIGMRVRLRG